MRQDVKDGPQQMGNRPVLVLSEFEAGGLRVRQGARVEDATVDSQGIGVQRGVRTNGPVTVGYLYRQGLLYG